MHPIKKANEAFQNSDWSTAALSYLDAAEKYPDLNKVLEFNFHWLRDHWLKNQKKRFNQGEKPKVAISCWCLSGNPAGRAIVLAEAWQRKVNNVEIVGSLFPEFGEELWQPIQDIELPIHYVVCKAEAVFVRDVFKLVLQYPYDLVHISKPRSPSLIFAKLYQLVWGAKIIFDIDDEELAFTDQNQLIKNVKPAALFGLRKTEWTHWTINQIADYPLRTVSNIALQHRYGGELLPHVKLTSRYELEKKSKQLARRSLGIPANAKVFIFAGTPRKHKGLIQAAELLAKINDNTIWFVVLGEFPNAELDIKKTIQDKANLNTLFLPNTAYSKIAETLIVGDVTLLLQDQKSTVSQFQLPAKLIDALAIGLTVFATSTPPLKPFIDAGVIFKVNDENLEEVLNSFISDWGTKKIDKESEINRQYFKEHLSVESIQPILQSLLEKAFNSQDEILPDWSEKLELLINDSYHFLIPRQ